MDALSAALGCVRTTGAIFSHLDCGAPWGFTVPVIETPAALLGAPSERVVQYHLVLEGRAHILRDGAASLSVSAGEVVVLPRSVAHVVSSSPRAAPGAFPTVPVESLLATRPERVRLGGGGAPTQIVCGFFGCERHADHLFLAGLPALFKVGLRGDAIGRWLEETVRQLVDEARAGRPGTAALLSRSAEALFVETLRRYLDTVPDDRTGWLAATRDPIVGAAVAHLHIEPQRSWTVAELARAVGTSASVLRERFQRKLGKSPSRYLTGWRLQLAARQLEETDKTVLEIATDVGYESEAAFNRAFKREVGMPPGRYRRRRPT